MTYYRMHETIVSEREFIEDATSWMWDFDDDGALYERELRGVYSAFKNTPDLLDYYDGSNDDTPVAIFEGEEISRPSSDAIGEVLVRPTRLLGWTTISDLGNLYPAKTS